MGFFDNLGKKASAAYDATAEKTGKLAKEAKLRMKINENKSNINELYKEIGKKVYEKHVREENIDIKTELEEECTKIDVLSAELETCLNSILELKDKKQCENCHAEIDLNCDFCPKCGTKLTAEPKQEETEQTEETANTVEKVTEILSQETQEEAQKEISENNDNNDNNESNE